MPYYIFHMNMDAHQCVRIDVLTKCTFAWMSYYTLHTNMVAPLYVCVHVFSDYYWNLISSCIKCNHSVFVCADVIPVCISVWISSDTLHKYKGGHPYMYHRNICIQHFLHEVVHSQYPAKTQRLNIRKYSDRKNNYFYSNVYIK